jgi:hypothetical protein
MLRWLQNLLFESTPAEFRSDYSIAESVQRLTAVTSRWAVSLSQTQAVGKVSPDKVRLQRVIPMVRNSFKPCFTGHFETRDGRTVLTGHFAIPMSARIFMVIWLAMATLFTVAFLAGDLRSPNGTPASLPLFGLLFPAAGIGLIVLGKWFARNDVAWLSDVMTRALTTPSDITLQKPSADLPGASEVLKLVAVFLAAAVIIPGVAVIDTPQVLPRWHTMYGAFTILVLVLAIGVWFRRPWAWWGGFIVLAAMMIAGLVTLPVTTRELPPLFLAAFAVCLLLVVGGWGGWWYGKRNLFLWDTTANSRHDGWDTTANSRHDGKT